MTRTDRLRFALPVVEDTHVYVCFALQFRRVMSASLTRVVLLEIVFSVLSFCVVGAQSGGRDLPLGFRSLAGVTLNQDHAATIRAKLGNTRERRLSGAHAGYSDWCYVPAEGPPRALLELMTIAGGKGMSDGALEVIRLRAEAPAAERAGCAPLPASSELSTPAGLRLGSSATNIQELLGPPSRRTADSVIYYFDAKQYLRPDTPEYDAWNTSEFRESCFDAGPPYANVAATIVVLLRDDRAVEIRVERDDQSVCGGTRNE